MIEIDILPDGWMVPSPFWSYFRFVTSHQPPRPNAIAAQFRQDVHSIAPYVLWFAGGAFIFAGYLWGSVFLLAVGATAFVMYSKMLLTTSKVLRDTPAVRVAIDSAATRKKMEGVIEASIVRANGTTLVFIMHSELADKVLGDGRRAECLVWDNPNALYGLTLAARPIVTSSGADLATSSSR